jgi:hypothetical protein
MNGRAAWNIAARLRFGVRVKAAAPLDNIARLPYLMNIPF